MLQTALIIFLTSFCFQTFAGPIAGVPNSLRRQFKSIHKFQEIELQIEGVKFNARWSEKEEKPILFYNIPKVSKAEIYTFIMGKYLPSGLSSLKAKVLEDGAQEYLIYSNKKIVEGAWVRIYDVEDGSVAIGTKLPHSGNILKFSSPVDAYLMLHNGKIVEFQKLIQDEDVLIDFPEDSELPDHIQRTVTAKKDETGTLKRYTLPEGTRFPDQIVFDSNSDLWFTQPSDNLLTRFDPVNEEWEQIPVGESPDGLFIDKKGRLWFGEYSGSALGMYDPKTKKYENYPVPYENSAPAIPYEDHLGLIWMSDHEANKVSVFDTLTQNWLVYEAPESEAWVVQLIQLDQNPLDIYATHCYANAIGHIDYVTRDYRQIPLGVTGCPAFFTPVNDILYISLWSGGDIIALNPETEEITEFEIYAEETKESGIGPVGRDEFGFVYFASLSNGRVYKADPEDMTVKFIEGIGGTKDGLVVDPKGNVWVTEISGGLVKVNFSKPL